MVRIKSMLWVVRMGGFECLWGLWSVESDSCGFAGGFVTKLVEEAVGILLGCSSSLS
jgi:hypothetical protein